MARTASSSEPPLINRPMVGLASLMCLAISFVTYLLVPDRDAVVGAFSRVGVVMGALWLALPPGREQLTWWRWLIVGVGLAVAVLRGGKALVAFLPIIALITVALILLRPRDKRRGR